jgi:hypothetical protein
MITVSRISGESFDLSSGKELPKSLALTNGQREILVVVDDEIIREVIQMEMESRHFPEKTLAEQPSVPRTRRPSTAAFPNVRLNPNLTQAATELAELPDEPEEEAPTEGDPGSDYEDPATGVQSL